MRHSNDTFIAAGLPVFLFALLSIAAGETAAQPAGASLEQPPRTLAEEAAVLANGRMSARQRALARLATHPSPEADTLLRKEFVRLREGSLPPALWLDLLEAVGKRADPGLKAMLAEREQALAKSVDPLSHFRECLEGGNAEAGRIVFTKRPEAGCVHCHTADGEGGQIGPDLTWLRTASDRLPILESIIVPNSTIATGFKSAVLTLKNGETIWGVVTAESEEELTVTSTVDGSRRRLKTTDIRKREPLPSLMPPHFGTVLDKRAIRDLVEFLAVGD